MSKTKKNNALFDLIHALSKNEKRHFKIYATRHVIGKQNNYLQLFDAIAAQKIYNETALKKQFAQQKFIHRLSSEKVYLHRLIMESLHVYHQDNSIDAQLKKALHQVEILHGKGLYAQADKALRKTKKIAYNNEEYLHILDVIKWEKTMLNAFQLAKKSDEALKQISEEEENIIRILANYNQYSGLLIEMWHFWVKKGDLRDALDRAKIEKIVAHSLMGKVDHALSIRARLYYYLIYYFYYSFKQNWEKVFEVLQASVNILESKPVYLKENLNVYANRLGLFLGSFILLNKYNYLFAQTLAKLRAIPETYKLKKGIFKIVSKEIIGSYNTELTILLRTSQIKKSLALIPSIEKLLHESESEILPHTRTLFYYRMALSCFYAGQINQAIHFNNEILNHHPKKFRQDLYGLSIVLNLILQYETQNHDIMEYHIKSAQRFFAQKEQPYLFEKAILKFFKTITQKITNKSDLQKELNRFKIELEVLRKDDYEKVMFEDCNYIAWLESKIRRCSLAEVLRGI